LLDYIVRLDEFDTYQFGFMKQHSTADVLLCAKEPLTTIGVMAVMCLLVLLTSKKLLIVLIIGNCFVKCWVTVHQLHHHRVFGS